MRMQRLWLTVAVLAGCQKEQPDELPRPLAAPAPGVAFAQPPPPAPAPTPPPPAPAPTTTVELTAVTLADDCGGAAPAHAPAKRALKAKSDSAHVSRGARRCEQTSMQLAITASAASTLTVKSVELFDERGRSLGKLAARKPTRWSDTRGLYEAWDEKLPAATLVNASYVLQQPNWARIGDRWNRTYTLKTVVSIDGVESSARKSVTLSAPTTLPPNVKT